MILMKNLILILILIFAAVSLNTMASNPVHVIITAGQSNTCLLYTSPSPRD